MRTENMDLVQKLKEKSNHLSRSEHSVMTETQTHCRLCDDSGWVWSRDQYGVPYCQECSCGIRKKMIHRNQLKFAKIPNTYKDAYLADMKESVYASEESKQIFTQSKTAIEIWAEDLEEMQLAGMGLYLYSYAKGSGKTKAVCALANEIIKKYPQKTVKFSTQPEIKTEIQKTWDRTKLVEGNLIEDLINAEILIIDDFGVSPSKDWVNEKFYEIINGRYVNRKITIYTANCCIAQLDCDDRITNRILERSLEIPFPEESVRKNIAEQMKRKMVSKIIRRYTK